MPQSVLVPVDGSNFAEHALPYALGIARRTGATLHLALVHVPAEPASPTHPISAALEAQQAELRDLDAEYVQSLAQRLDPSGVSIRPALIRGRVAPVLESYVEEHGVGLVVMTTHGRGGLQRAWLGSTADSLIRNCLIPLLVVRPSESTREVGPESDRSIARILASLDGSETAEIALKDALQLGITEGADVVLTHVLNPAIPAASPYLPHTVPLAPDERAARRGRMEKYLASLVEGPALEGWSCETRLVLDHQPAPAILDLSEELDVDLVVLGTHGRGGLRRLLLGSVADKVIRGTHRPVLVHRGVSRISRLTHRGEPDRESGETGAGR